MKKQLSFDGMPERIEALMAIASQILDATKQKPLQLIQEPQKEILSTKETCELLGINRTTLWMWEKKGTVKSYGVEGRKFFKRSEIMEMLIPLN